MRSRMVRAGPPTRPARNFTQVSRHRDGAGKGGADAALWWRKGGVSAARFDESELEHGVLWARGPALITICDGLAGHKDFTADGASTAEPYGAASAGHGGSQGKNIKGRAGVDRGGRPGGP